MPVRRTGNRVELAAVIRKNAEDLMLELCGKKYERAYNPNCPPKKRGRRQKNFKSITASRSWASIRPCCATFGMWAFSLAS